MVLFASIYSEFLLLNGDLWGDLNQINLIDNFLHLSISMENFWTFWMRFSKLKAAFFINIFMFFRFLFGFVARTVRFFSNRFTHKILPMPLGFIFKWFYHLKRQGFLLWNSKFRGEFLQKRLKIRSGYYGKPIQHWYWLQGLFEWRYFGQDQFSTTIFKAKWDACWSQR